MRRWIAGSNFGRGSPAAPPFEAGLPLRRRVPQATKKAAEAAFS
jgi:hypothetical protein